MRPKSHRWVTIASWDPPKVKLMYNPPVAITVYKECFEWTAPKACLCVCVSLKQWKPRQIHVFLQPFLEVDIHRPSQTWEIASIYDISFFPKRPKLETFFFQKTQEWSNWKALAEVIKNWEAELELGTRTWFFTLHQMFLGPCYASCLSSSSYCLKFTGWSP